MEQRIRRVKVRKLMGCNKGSVIGKGKATHTSKAKQGIHSLLPISRQVFSHLQESRAPSHRTVTWEDKCHNSECPPFSLLPPTLYAEHDVIWHGLSLRSVGLAVRAVSPPLFLCAPGLLAGGTV